MKDLKHIKSIEALDNAYTHREKTLKLAKELRQTVEYHNSKYSIQKSSSHERYNLIKLDGDNTEVVLHNETPSSIQRHLRLRDIDPNTIHGAVLIYKNLSPSDEYKSYDDYIENIEKIMGTLKELSNSINHEYSTYKLHKYTEGVATVRYILSEGKSNDELAHGTKGDILRYITRHKIDIDDIYDAHLLNDVNNTQNN
jgi:negative regulator of sigma E activity